MRPLAAVAIPLVLLATAGRAAAPGGDAGLARAILADAELSLALDRARALLKSGFNAGSGYGEVWIRDFNTFIELALTVNDPATIRAQLLPFFRFQGPDGDIVDGVIPAARADVGYKYRRSDLEPGLLAHKNTVETDQESSLVLAVARYVAGTGDTAFLDEAIAGRTVRERLRLALEYVHRHRFAARHGLVWGATTIDWGDVQPEHVWGVEWDADSHPAIDVYDNALYLTAIDAFVRLPGTAASDRAMWPRLAESIRRNVRKRLWDAKRRKFRPHVYLDRGSPFPASFDEDRIHYHGGTTVAMEAGLLSAREVGVVLEQMRANRRAVGAGSIGLTVHPVYPEGFFKNPQVRPFGYQNGGDWTWFGGRTIQQLVRHGRVAEAYEDARPMVARALRDGFVEWYDVYNRPQGSREFRGAAGTLGQAIVLLQAWAREHVIGRQEADVIELYRFRGLPAQIWSLDTAGGTHVAVVGERSDSDEVRTTVGMSRRLSSSLISARTSSPPILGSRRSRRISAGRGLVAGSAKRPRGSSSPPASSRRRSSAATTSPAVGAGDPDRAGADRPGHDGPGPGQCPQAPRRL